MRKYEFRIAYKRIVYMLNLIYINIHKTDTKHEDVYSEQDTE